MSKPITQFTRGLVAIVAMAVVTFNVGCARNYKAPVKTDNPALLSVGDDFGMHLFGGQKARKK